MTLIALVGGCELPTILSYVLFCAVSSCSLLICPVLCYALLFVCAAGNDVIKQGFGGEGGLITRYSIAQIFFSNFLIPSQSFSNVLKVSQLFEGDGFSKSQMTVFAIEVEIDCTMKQLCYWTCFLLSE